MDEKVLKKVIKQYVREALTEIFAEMQLETIVENVVTKKVIPRGYEPVQSSKFSIKLLSRISSIWWTISSLSRYRPKYSSITSRCCIT